VTYEFISDKQVLREYYIAEALHLPFGEEGYGQKILKFRLGPGKCILNPSELKQETLP
jgi:hypothetical protein